MVNRESRKQYPIPDTRSTIHGFSMIELVSALAIFSIMALAMYIVFDRANQVWRHGEYKADQYQNVRSVLDQMSRELTACIIGTGGPASFTSNDPQKRPYLFSVNATQTISGQSYDRDQIYFVFPRTNTIYEAGYYINDKGNANGKDDVLKRAYTSGFGASGTDFDISATDQFGSNDDFAFRVTDLDFKFIYKDSSGNYQKADVWDTRFPYYAGGGSTTVTAIDDGQLPDWIEISIRVVDQETLDKNNGNPAKADRKEFKTLVPMNQRRFSR